MNSSFFRLTIACDGLTANQIGALLGTPPDPVPRETAYTQDHWLGTIWRDDVSSWPEVPFDAVEARIAKLLALTPAGKEAHAELKFVMWHEHQSGGYTFPARFLLTLGRLGVSLEVEVYASNGDDAPSTNGC